jgi:predicted dehydrogenase
MQNIILTGFGFMGTMHAQIYQKLKQARIVAVVDNDTLKAEKSMADLKVDAPLFADLPSALAAVESTAVDICLPTDEHLEHALLAIRAGKHLFCEKPIALTYADAQKITAAAARAGVTAQVGHCIRFWPEYQALRDFIKKGSAGKLKSLTLQRRSSLPDHSVGHWLRDPARSGGAAIDLHIHDTDFVLYLLGKPTAVHSVATLDANGPSHISTHYRYPEIEVSSEGGWNYPANWGFQMAFQTVFEQGAVEFDSGQSPSLVATVGSGPRKALPVKTPSVGNSSTGAGNISSLGGYFNELQSFIRALEAKRPPETATLEDATQSLKIVLAELKSATTGKSVKL